MNVFAKFFDDCYKLGSVLENVELGKGYDVGFVNDFLKNNNFEEPMSVQIDEFESALIYWKKANCLFHLSVKDSLDVSDDNLWKRRVEYSAEGKSPDGVLHNLLMRFDLDYKIVRASIFLGEENDYFRRRKNLIKNMYAGECSTGTMEILSAYKHVFLNEIGFEYASAQRVDDSDLWFFASPFVNSEK